MSLESLRRVRTFGVVSLVVGIAAACSAGKGGGGGPGGNGGSGNNGTGGSGASAGINIGFGGGLSLGGMTMTNTSGGAGAPPVVHTACTTTADCKTANSVCVKPGPDSGITGPGECAPITGMCGADDACAQDSYCCGEGCQLATGDKVCIPFDFGLTPECKLPGAAAVFAPSVQCEWAPTATDPQAASKYVLSTPLVANMANDSGASAEVVFTTWDAMTVSPGGPALDGGSSSTPGMIRIVNGQNCELKETVQDSIGKVRAGSPMALADLDNDGKIEIVSRRDTGGVIAFKWDGTKHVKMWETVGKLIKPQVWDGPAIHDLNDDGLPEVLVGDAVYNGQTGALIYDAADIGITYNGYIAVAAALNGDGKPKLIGSYRGETTTYSWTNDKWVDDAATHQNSRLGFPSGNYAVADFGTPVGAGFDLTKFDGIADIVGVEVISGVGIFSGTWSNTPPASALRVPQSKFDYGGPPTVGDFDGDGQPEVAIAGKKDLVVFDPECKAAGNGCADAGIRWRQPSQDSTSGQTGVALFDFDGDGKVEVVYADECFLRIYSGPTGEVLFSAYRTSSTWYESPVVADVDNDDATEIIVNNAMAAGCSDTRGPAVPPTGVPYVDPLDPGVRCLENADCVPGGKCMAGFCRCSGATECDAGLSCVDPPAKSANVPNPPSAAEGKVCRATNPNSTTSKGGIRILRDRLDRTASSRPLWNQQSYSITNINDDGKIPKTSEWLANWKQPGMNNYRMQKQGVGGAQDAPDITGKLDAAACVFDGTTITLTGKVCNRGNKAVGADMPVTFYDANNKVLCVSHTLQPVKGKNDCQPVSCEIKEKVMGKITMKVNDDQGGGQTAKECNASNNTDSVTIEGCQLPQ